MNKDSAANATTAAVNSAHSAGNAATENESLVDKQQQPSIHQKGFNNQRPGNNRQKERSYSLDLLFLLFSIGSHGEERIALQLQEFKDEILSNWSNEQANIIDLLVRSARELADKSILMAYTVAMVNESSPEIGLGMVKALKEALDQSLADFDWRAAKLLLRVVASLATVNVIDLSEILNIYAVLLGVLDELNPKEERRDTLVGLILGSLPWVGNSLQIKFAQELSSLLERVEKYITIGRSKRVIAAKAVAFFTTNCPYEQVDTLALLWMQVQDCKNRGWLSPFLYYPAIELTGEMHPFGSIRKPQDIQGKQYPLLRTRTELLNPQVATRRGFAPQVPEAPSINYYIIYDTLTDIVAGFQHNAQELLRYIKHSLCFPLTADQKQVLPSIYQPFVEILMSGMLGLPVPEHKMAYYAFVIIELCKQETKVIPPILGKCIFTIFERFQDTDVEVQSRFSSWFSHHLSNFNYQWNWKEWSIILEVERSHPAALFVREALEKCVRLSYWERVAKQLPSGFEGLMPVQPEPTFKYQGSGPFPVDPESITFAQRFLEGMRLKQSFEEMQQLYSEIVAFGASKGISGFDKSEPVGTSLARDIIVQCVLFMGSKSLSHVLNAVERHLKLLEHVNRTQEARYETVRIVEDFWYKNHQFLMLVLEKLINYKIIDPVNVVDWIFAPERTSFYHTYLWTLLKTVVAKTNNRINQISKKLESTRKALAAAQEAAVNSGAMDVDLGVTGSSETLDMEVEHQTQSKAEKHENVEETISPAEAGLVVDEAHGKDASDTTEKLSEKLSNLSSNLDQLKRDQKHLYIHIFQKFLSSFKGLNVESEDFVQNRVWLIGMMREFARWAHEEVATMAFTLETMVFTPTNDCEELNQVFQCVKAIHS